MARWLHVHTAWAPWFEESGDGIGSDGAELADGGMETESEDDLIVDFGPSFGLWVFLNNTTWTQLHPLSPEEMATGEIDGN